MRYTITRFNKDFPDEDACLKFLFESKQLKACPRCGTEPKFYKLKGRKCYSCMHCALHIYPTDGTYHCVSPKHLQLYVDEFVYRYNLRNAPVFPALIALASQPVARVGESHV